MNINESFQCNKVMFDILRSVLLGVLDQRVSDKIFKATIERRLAQLLTMHWVWAVALKEQLVWETTACRFVNHPYYMTLYLYSCFPCMSSLDSFIELFLCACLMPLWVLNQSLSLWRFPTPALPPHIIIIQGQGVSMATPSYSSLACRATQKTTISPLSAHHTPAAISDQLLNHS